MKIKTCLFSVLVAASALCSVASVQESKFALEGSAGRTFFKFRRDQFRNAQFAATTGNTASLLSVRDHDMSYRLGGSYQITQAWGIDAAWQDNGSIRVRGIAPTSATVSGAFSTLIHQTLVSAGASYVFPHVDGPLGYAVRFGFSRWDNEYKHTGVPIVGMHDESGTSPYAEFGTRWQVRPQIALGLNLGYQWGMQASTRLSGSLRYSF